MDIKPIKIRRKNIKDSFQSELLQNLTGRKKNFNFVQEWERLGKEINKKWDSISLEDELNYQRNKNS